MKMVLALALFFSKSQIKQKATLLLLLLNVFIFIVALSVGDIDIGKKYKLFEDLLLSGQMFTLLIASLLYSFEFIQKEKYSGIHILPLSTSMTRNQYMSAVFLSHFYLISMIVFMLIAFDIVVLLLVEGDVIYRFLWQVVLYGMSSLLVAFFVILFSRFVSVMNSMIYAIVLYALGNALDELYIYAYYLKDDVLFQKISTVLMYIIPNMYRFDQIGSVVNRSFVSTYQLYIFPTVYFVTLAWIVYIITALKFKNKALKVGD